LKTRLYLKWQMNDQSLRDQFKKYGNITEARVVNPRIHSFGFITFSSEAEANAAREAMNGARLQSGELTVEHAASEPKERKQRAPRTRENNAERTSGAPAPRKQERQERPPAEKAPVNPRAGVQNSVNVVPDPVAFPLTKESVVEELKAGDRKFRTGNREPKEGRLVDNCSIRYNAISQDFSIGGFNLKLSSISIKSDKTDTKVRMKVSNPASGRAGELYFRMRADGPNYKFFELREEQEPSEEPKPISTNFLSIESINLDRTTGSWRQINLSLYHAEFPRRVRREKVTPAADAQPAVTESGAPDSLPRQRKSNGRPRGRGRRPRGGGGAGAEDVSPPS